MADNSPINLAAFKDGLTNYVVQPLNAFGIGGFVFDTEGESVATLTAEITDHFVEDGATISDHIAIKPKKVTLKNYVGELVYRQDDSTDTPVQNAVRKLTTISSYLPKITDMAQQVMDNREKDGGIISGFKNSVLGSNRIKTINGAADLWSFGKNVLSGDSKQQQAYMYFKAMMEQKILTSIQTPFEFMTSMAIESITATQQENEKYVSDFSVTFKQIRLAKEIVSKDFSIANKVSSVVTQANENLGNLQGRISEQVSNVSNLGNISGVDYDRIEIQKAANAKAIFAPAPPIPGF